MVWEPGKQVADRFGVGGLGGEQGGELCLTAGASEIDDELARDRRRGLSAVIVGDQREREVDSGRDSGRRPDVAVVDVDRVEVDRHSG